MHVMLTPARRPRKWKEENSRENEAVTVEPLWVLWVELQELAVENVGHWCHAPVLKALSAWLEWLVFKSRASPRDPQHLGRGRAEAGKGRCDKEGQYNVHGRTRVARVGMGGRIGLEGEMVSTIDHIEAWLLVFAR